MALPHTRMDIRTQQIARYRVCGRLTDKQIAEIMGMSIAGLKYVISTPQYIELEDSLLQGHVSKMDMELAGNVEELRNHFRVAVPVAARTLLEVVQQRRDLRAALSAASEILDRDPEHVFSKQSRNAPMAGVVDEGNAFNPATAGDMLATMTSDAAKVTVQITASSVHNSGTPGSGHTLESRQALPTEWANGDAKAPTFPDSQQSLPTQQPTTLVGNSPLSTQNDALPQQVVQQIPPSQLPLFDVESGRF